MGHSCLPIARETFTRFYSFYNLLKYSKNAYFMRISIGMQNENVFIESPTWTMVISTLPSRAFELITPRIYSKALCNYGRHFTINFTTNNTNEHSNLHISTSRSASTCQPSSQYESFHYDPLASTIIITRRPHFAYLLHTALPLIYSIITPWDSN